MQKEVLRLEKFWSSGGAEYIRTINHRYIKNNGKFIIPASLDAAVDTMYLMGDAGECIQNMLAIAHQFNHTIDNWVEQLVQGTREFTVDSVLDEISPLKQAIEAAITATSLLFDEGNEGPENSGS